MQDHQREYLRRLEGQRVAPELPLVSGIIYGTLFSSILWGIAVALWMVAGWTGVLVGVLAAIGLVAVLALRREPR